MGRILALATLLAASMLQAKDLGTHGQTFPVLEEDLLAVMENRLANFDSDQLDSRALEEAARRPRPVRNLAEATRYRCTLFNPSITVQQDILDYKGAILFPTGTTINPLDAIAMSGPLLFLNGDNPAHVQWARTQDTRATQASAQGLADCGQTTPIWVLINGSPSQLEEEEGRPVYFDQSGTLVLKLGIQHIPARASQQGNRLRIEEIPIDSQESGRGGES